MPGVAGAVFQSLRMRHREFDEFLFESYAPEAIGTLEIELEQFLDKADKTLYLNLLRDHFLLDVKYSALCLQIRYTLCYAELCKRGIVTVAVLEHCHVLTANKLCTALMEASVLTLLLKFLRQRYLPQDLSSLLDRQNYIKFLLLGGEPSEQNPSKLSQTEKIRRATARATWYRLATNRSHNAFNKLAKATDWPWFLEFSTTMSDYITPVLKSFALGFFTPRLVVNGKSVTDSFVVKQDNKKLTAWEHAKVQIDYLKYELGNDVPWWLISAANVLGATIAPLLNLIGYAYDMTLAYLRRKEELDGYTTLEDLFGKINNDASMDFLRYLKIKKEFDVERLNGNLLAAVGVFLGGIAALGIFSSSPNLALLGACTLLSVSIYLWVHEKRLAPKRPDDNIINSILPKESPITEAKYKMDRDPAEVFTYIETMKKQAPLTPKEELQATSEKTDETAPITQASTTKEVPAPSCFFFSHHRGILPETPTISSGSRSPKNLMPIGDIPPLSL